MAGPLQGRRLYFVGIGGSGMSAYANVADGWGAEVAGWEAGDTIFLRSLAEGIEVDLGGEPRPPAGFEVIVSTAHAHRIEGTPRAEFLAELVAARPSVVVAGAHGKTTTAAMIAFALCELGERPRLGDRGCRAPARRECRHRRRLARGRRGRVRPLAVLARTADRRGHESRARPSRHLRIGGRSSRRVRGVARGRADVRRRLGAPAVRRRARRAGCAQPAERGTRDRGARGHRDGP